MKILILGGTGAMGMSLVPILAERGHEITVTSRHPYEDKPQIHYCCGNSHEDRFLNILLQSYWDVIVDFMNYTAEEFSHRVERFLLATGQYIFLSSSRVYANSEEPLTEESARLLDCPPSQEYLRTKEYALEKAKAEDLLQQSSHKNWTIIRPYITYNSNRLQLGTLEKENWLLRVLEGRSIVFPQDISLHKTTMTFGEDVAKIISDLVGNIAALGECVHIATEESLLWQDILEIYSDILEKKTNNRPQVIWLRNSKKWAKYGNNMAQVYYDRLYNRTFSNLKVEKLNQKHFEYTRLRDGLEYCLTKFLNEQNFEKEENRNWKFEAFADTAAHERWELYRIPGIKQKIKYCVYRLLAIIDGVEKI